MIITSKYESYCKACHRLCGVGERVGWQPGEKGIWCEACAPTAVKQPGGPATAGNGKVQDAWIIALAALEEAIVQQAAQVPGRSTEMERGWTKYQKLKALALAPGTHAEGRQALKLAVLEAVKLAFDRS